MKKIILAIAAIFAVVLTSCNKEETNDYVTNPEGEGTLVELRFASDVPTRAFFDESVTPEPWESALNSMIVYVFDSSGDLILDTKFSEAELSEKKITFSLPNSTNGQEISFYAVANMEVDTKISSISQAEELKEGSHLQKYNGLFSDLVTGNFKTEGFGMTGKTSALIGQQGKTTSVSISLKRLVSKVVVRTKMSENFTTIYNGGTVVINDVTLSKAPNISYFFLKEDYSIPNHQLQAFKQVPGNIDGYNNLFYIYEKNPASEEEKVTLTLQGYFDRDGKSETTNDRTDVEYTVTLDGSGAGRILRNGYYRLDLTVNGLGDTDVIISISVADWESPITQNVDLGV